MIAKTDDRKPPRYCHAGPRMEITIARSWSLSSITIFPGSFNSGNALLVGVSAFQPDRSARREGVGRASTVVVQRWAGRLRLLVKREKWRTTQRDCHFTSAFRIT